MWSYSVSKQVLLGLESRLLRAKQELRCFGQTNSGLYILFQTSIACSRWFCDVLILPSCVHHNNFAARATLCMTTLLCVFRPPVVYHADGDVCVTGLQIFDILCQLDSSERMCN